MMKLLIVNCVEWSEAHKDLHYPDDVGQWTVDSISRNDVEYSFWLPQRESEPPKVSFDGAIISGSASSVYDEDEWIVRVADFIKSCVERNTPLLGICFGHQLIAQALGGKVEKNPLGWEVGTCTVNLTEAGKNDPLFQNIEPSFQVMQSHQDIVTEAPAGSTVLASNEICVNQSLAIGDRVRTFQFHPEYTHEHMKFIVEPRRSRLENAGVDVDRTIECLVPLPGIEIIIKNFLQHYIESYNLRGA